MYIMITLTCTPLLFVIYLKKKDIMSPHDDVGFLDGVNENAAHRAEVAQASTYRQSMITHVALAEAGAQGAGLDKALNVVERVSAKLRGKDFGSQALDVPAQVQLLIDQATSHENLCQLFGGWCPFW